MSSMTLRHAAFSLHDQSWRLILQEETHRRFPNPDTLKALQIRIDECEKALRDAKAALQTAQEATK